MNTAVGSLNATQSRRIVAVIAILFSLVAGMTLGVASPARADWNDDYPAPWRAPTAKDTVVDSWGYWNLECTSFVAWRLHGVNGFEMPHAIGDASAWSSWASSHGYQVDRTPVKGSVAWWSRGHVAWVESVSGNNVTVEDYNGNNPFAFNEQTIPISSITSFIHFKDITGSQSSLRATVALDDPKTGGPINVQPLHKSRPMRVLIYNINNQLVLQSQPTATQVAAYPDRYTVNISLPQGWASGYYQVKVRLDYTLYVLAEGISVITNGRANVLSIAPLKVGDVNEDNAINILDYNLILSCYSDLLPPTGPCSALQKRAADLNDDGYVNQLDYNLFLRVIGSA